MTAAVWTAGKIGRALVKEFLQAKCLLVVPECYWTGHECDLLAVTRNARIIDIEIKISRADLKADAGKNKWWTRSPHSWYRPPGETWEEWDARTKLARDWPPRIWKHYYCMPAGIWKPELIDCLPSKASGVLTVENWHGRPYIKAVRRAKPCRTADQISAANCLDLARLAGLRMWDVLDRIDTNQWPSEQHTAMTAQRGEEGEG